MSGGQCGTHWCIFSRHGTAESLTNESNKYVTLMRIFIYKNYLTIGTNTRTTIKHVKWEMLTADYIQFRSQLELEAYVLLVSVEINSGGVL